MKFTFLKFKKNKPPTPKSLRPPLFNVNLFWTLALGLFVSIVVITSIISFKFFYYEYYQSYKEDIVKDNFEDLIDVSRLKNTIENRNNFINQPISIPKDPSI